MTDQTDAASGNNPRPLTGKPQRTLRSRAWKFVLLVGVMSFFADFTYEGARSVIGPYLGLLGASAAVIGIVTGLGELLGYGLRLVSGRLSDRTGQFWPIIIFGYVIQMASVPLLALAGNWPMAAALIIIERIGKATRNPPRDVMLSHAAQEIGYGRVFGAHEALDQAGALFGPLLVAAVLALRGDYRIAFATLAIPALVMLSLLAVARFLYPRPEEMETHPPDVNATGLPRVFWIYLAGAVLVAVGFADFPLIAYHFQQAQVTPAAWVPAFYAVAMGVSGSGSFVFGRLYDRFGLGVLIPLTLISALFAPLVFLGNFWMALIGAALWGLGIGVHESIIPAAVGPLVFLGNFWMALIGAALWGLGIGVHESIIPAAVGPMVPASRRTSAYGLFTAGYGIFWFLGSAAIGLLYGVSVPVVVIFSLVAEFAAIPFFLVARRRQRTQPATA